MSLEVQMAQVEKDVEYLKTCCSKMDTLKNGDSKQNQSLTELTNHVKSLEAGMDRHLEWHDKREIQEKEQDKDKDKKKWDVWKILIALIITTVGGVIAAKIF